MLVTVIIPAYNRAHVVDRTLDSVAAQTHRPLQVVLVDNDSSDGTLAALQRFAEAHRDEPDMEVIVTSASHHTAGAARNQGFEHATGEWVLFFDSDDVMQPRLVESYVAAIERAGGEVDIVSARSTLVRRDGTRVALPFHTSGDLMPVQILNSQLATQRYAVRREFFAGTDGWNIGVPVWNDWELGIRLLLRRPRVVYMTCGALITIHDSGAASITGESFAAKVGQWEHVIDISRLNITLSGELEERERTYYLRLIEFKRLTLAGLYEHEGRSDLARPLCRQGYNALRDSYGDSMKWRWLVAPVTRLLFRRIAAGKRGAATIARRLFRL